MFAVSLLADEAWVGKREKIPEMEDFLILMPRSMGNSDCAVGMFNQPPSTSWVDLAKGRTSTYILNELKLKCGNDLGIVSMLELSIFTTYTMKGHMVFISTEDTQRSADLALRKALPIWTTSNKWVCTFGEFGDMNAHKLYDVDPVEIEKRQEIFHKSVQVYVTHIREQIEFQPENSYTVGIVGITASGCFKHASSVLYGNFSHITWFDTNEAILKMLDSTRYH